MEGRDYNAVGMESANEDGSFSHPRQARFRQHLFLVWASRGFGPAHVLRRLLPWLRLLQVDFLESYGVETHAVRSYLLRLLFLRTAEIPGTWSL